MSVLKHRPPNILPPLDLGSNREDNLTIMLEKSVHILKGKYGTQWETQQEWLEMVLRGKKHRDAELQDKYQ